MDNTEKEIQPTKSKSKAEDPPKPIEEPILLISLEVYCDGLDQSGIDKFAQTRIQGEINGGRIPAGDKSREEWESIYLKLKNL